MWNFHDPVKRNGDFVGAKMVDIINGMFCVSYQIIRNHKGMWRCFIPPLMGTTLASALDIGLL